jgi:hypothetical protein
LTSTSRFCAMTWGPVVPEVKFTAERRRLLAEVATEGHSRETCADLAGIDRHTLSRWLKRGEESPVGSTYREFAQEYLTAEAAARGRALRILNQAMVDQPKWAAWFLEHRDPAFAPYAKASESAPSVIIKLRVGGGRAEPRQVENLAQPGLPGA